jgi:hypothetical protein
LSSEPVTVAVIRSVRSGCERAFEDQLHQFIERSLREPGQLGVHVLRPAPGSGSREYGILRRFTDTAARDAFYGSAVFREWLAEVEPFVDGPPRYGQVSGLETWFTLPGQRAMVPPPRWKMAVMTLVAVYPCSVLIPRALHPFTDDWPLGARGVAVAAVMVMVLTWVIMPVLARLFHRWLHAGET